MAVLTVVTGNPNKAKEIARIFTGVEMVARSFDAPEIQSFVLEEIVRAKAQNAWKEFQSPVLVEDVSLDLAVLNGFPGPFVKYFQQVTGYDRAVECGKALGNTQASVRCGVGYFDGKDFQYFEGKVDGDLVEKRGETGGFGFDFYFQPKGSSKTYGEMGLEEKNKISHRKLAWEGMRALLVDHGVIDAV